MTRNLTFGSVLAALALNGNPVISDTLGASSIQSSDVQAAWEAGGVKKRGHFGRNPSNAARAKRIARKRKNIRARGKK